MINSEQIKKLRVGSILENEKKIRFAVTFKMDDIIGMYDYYNGNMCGYFIEHIIEKFTLVEGTDSTNMILNINRTVAGGSLFMNTAIKLMLDNPEIYHRTFKNFEMYNKNLAYTLDKELVLEKIIKDKRTGKSYTLIDVENISDQLFFILERVGNVLGKAMEYEKLYVPKCDIDMHYEFAHDKIKDYESEPVYLYTSDEVKDMMLNNKPEIEETDKKPGFINICDKFTNITNIDNISKLVNHNANYLDIFRGGLVKGETYPVLSPESNQYIIITDIKYNTISYDKYFLDIDDTSVFMYSGNIGDVELYKILSYSGSIEYNGRTRTPEAVLSYYQINCRLEMMYDLKCVDTDGNKYTIVRDGDANGRVYDDKGNDTGDDLNRLMSYTVRGKTFYRNFYMPVRLNDFVLARNYGGSGIEYNIGDIFIFDKNIHMVLCKINKKSFGFYLNMLNRSKVIRIKISKELMSKHSYKFLHNASLSIPEIAKM